MDKVGKLKLLAEHMELEPAEELSSRSQMIPLRSQDRARSKAGINTSQPAPASPPPCHVPDRKRDLGIYMAALPGGKKKPILKTMLTSACERDCFYCPFRAGRNYRRVTFKPEEMAQTTVDMVRAGMVEGLFLSSGIIRGGVATQDKLLATAEILRHKHRYNGYIHLKIMPGAEKAQVERAMALADRVSVNLEAPNSRRLQMLAPRKQFIEELLQPLRWAEELRRQVRRPAPQRSSAPWARRWASTVTQFVVGAVGESDLELLSTVAHLYQELALRRTYFSTFRPVPDTPLAEHPPADPLREFRLYQSSFLLRDYGYDMEEMPFDALGNLPLNIDPKLAWAHTNLREEPVEVNRAGRSELLRVPGIGPKGAGAIVGARRRGKLREIRDLKAIGVVTSRLAPFVLLDGRRPPIQLPLFV